MRRIIPLMVFSALLLVSCDSIKDSRTLKNVETFMAERPDSALAVLRGLQPRDLPGLHVRPLHALLLSEALDKNYIDLTDDSLAVAANHYYGDHGSKLHRLKSWYYLGRVRFNAGNYAEAVICYNKALDYAEALTNYHYVGLINREIANAYSGVWDDYHAIRYIQESINAFELAKENRYSAYSKLSLARLYYRQKQFENCQDVLMDLGNYSGEMFLSSSVSELKAQLAVADGSKDFERILSDFYESGIGVVLLPTAPRYSSIAYVHQMLGDLDSADFYMSRAEQLIKTAEDSAAVLYKKSLIETGRGNYENANGLLNSAIHLQDSSVYSALKQSVSFYQGNYYQNESRMNEMKGRIRALYSCLLIVCLMVFSFFLLSRNRKQRNKILEEMMHTAEIRQELSILQGKKHGMNLALSTLFENRLRILTTLSEQYELLEERQQRKMREKGTELSRDEIIDLFRDKMRDLRKDKDITLSMEEILNVWKDGIILKMRDVLGPDGSGNVHFTKEELELAPFFFSGMKTKTISYLTGFTEPSLRVRKTRIKQKVSNLDNTFAREKHLFLENL